MSTSKNQCVNATLETALTLLQHGWVSIDQLRQANKWRLAQRPAIGKLAHNCGKLTMAEVCAVLEQQKVQGKMFGETAVDLGLISPGEVYELLRIQAEFTPSLLEALIERIAISPEQQKTVLNAIADLEVHLVSAGPGLEAVLS